MGQGLLSEVRAMRSALGADNRCVDLACQFEVYARIADAPEDGPYATPTGRRSRVYGGRYDKRLRRIIGPANPSAVVVYPCSAKQFDLVTADASRIEGNGGRGSGKSEAGVLRAIRHICDSPGVDGQCVSPTFDLTNLVWRKLLEQIPIGWLKPGLEGISRAERTLHFTNRVNVRFRSADNPESLRGWDGEWTFVDEEGDVSSYAFGVIWPSLRKSARPCLWSVGTPKAGDYRDRHDELVAKVDDPAVPSDRKPVTLRFDSYTNPFVSHNSFHESRRNLTEALYRQEILAEWENLDESYVCRREFDPGRHGLVLPRPTEDEFMYHTGAPPGWVDITEDVIASDIGQKLARGKRYIAGGDYQMNSPNVVWIYRVFKGSPRRWLVVDIIDAGGETSWLGQEMRNKGYTGHNTVVVDDASGEFNTYGGKRSPNSSARLMRKMGFTCIHPKRNPLIKDRVNALLCKLAPLEGEPSWFYDKRLETRVKEVMTQIRWNSSGKDLDKEQGVDHDFDAATYPLHRFEPPARGQIPTHGSIGM